MYSWRIPPIRKTARIPAYRTGGTSAFRSPAIAKARARALAEVRRAHVRRSEARLPRVTNAPRTSTATSDQQPTVANWLRLARHWVSPASAALAQA